MTDGVQRRVQPQRQADAHDLTQGAGVKTAGQNRQRKLCAAADVKNAAYPRQKQRNRRGSCHAADAKTERAGKYKIQHDIRRAADKQQLQRRRAVAQAAQKTCVEVIAHIAQNAQHRDAQIQHRPRHGVCRDLHQPQHPRPQQQPDNGQRQGRRKQQPHRGAHELLQLVTVTAPDCLRHQNGNARTDAHKDTEQNFERLRACRHRGQRCGIAKIADDERVHRAVQKLQNIARADGQRKQRRAPQHRAVGHINLCGISVSRHKPHPPWQNFLLTLYAQTAVTATIIILCRFPAFCRCAACFLRKPPQTITPFAMRKHTYFFAVLCRFNKGSGAKSVTLTARFAAKGLATAAQNVLSLKSNSVKRE